MPVQNLAGILRDGMKTQADVNRDADYVFIGDRQLTHDRHEYPIPIDGYGNLGDYVPFYFGQRSPMLLNIITGYRGITKRPQTDIVYLCCRLDDLVQADLRFVFTDGHAKNHLTSFFTSVDDLHRVDWPMVKERVWNNTENDLDRQRRKQSELLVHKHVSPDLIRAIVVYDEEKRIFVQQLIAEAGHTIPIHINPRNDFYY